MHAYPPGTEEDLAETVRQVEALDRRIVAHKADVRDTQALKAAVDGVAQLGRRDIVSANAGIYQMQPAVELDDDDWQETIDTGRSFGDHGHQTAALSVEV